MACDQPDIGAGFLAAHRAGNFIQLASPGANAPPPSSSSSSNTVEAHSAENHLAASSGRNARMQAAVACPFDRCPYSKKQLPKATLVGHLSARHVAAGQTVPAAVLQMLRHKCCAHCRTLYANGSTCQCQSAGTAGVAEQTSSQVAPPEVPEGNLPQGTSTSLANACPVLVPTLDELLAAPISTVRHIPNACRGDIAACMSSLINAFVIRRSWESLHRLQCFPKLVLRAPSRAGRAHAKQLAMDISRRLRLFMDGHLATLWAESQAILQRPKVLRTRAQRAAQDAPLSPSDIRAIRSLVEEGALSKAAKHLLSDGLADASDPMVLERLRSLHPSANPIATGGDHALPATIDPSLNAGEDACDWGKLAWHAVTSFSPGSVPTLVDSARGT